MQTLVNQAVEPPEREFVVEFVAFGTTTRAAVKRTVKVLAKTRAGAKRIVRARYVRSGHHTVVSEMPAQLGLVA